MKMQGKCTLRKATCLNTEETIMEGHTHEHGPYDGGWVGGSVVLFGVVLWCVV